MNPIGQFIKEKDERIDNYSKDEKFKKVSYEWLTESFQKQYEYNFTWLGRPIIQYPSDILAMQEIIWQVKPDLIIETGIAHGGSIIFSASMLEIIGHGEVIAIDIDIRKHNKDEIEKHPMCKRITMIEGSSIDPNTIEKVKESVKNKLRVLVFLDSNHTHEHVLEELKLYSPFVTINSYIIVFDTFLEDLPAECSNNRPWGKGNNPKTAVWEFMKSNDSFYIDKTFENKLVITSSPDGYLKRIK
ncbi:MAG: cephalosporin hydroxylase family protein [Mariniphaga sp.]